MKRVVILLFILGIVFFAGEASAQCAMCRASLENNVSNGDIGYAARLNFGILYLFVLPYLLVFTIGFLWYKKSKQNKARKVEAEKRRRKLADLGL